MNKWTFDGECLRPPTWIDNVYITFGWCGRSPVQLRGKKGDGSLITIATIPGGEPGTPRHANAVLDMGTYVGVAVGATWTAEDLDANCAVSLIAQILPPHGHSTDDINGLSDVLNKKSDKGHRHKVSEIDGIAEILDTKQDKDTHKADVSSLNGRIDSTVNDMNRRPAMWLWDGQGKWSAPAGAVVTDNVLNLHTGEIHTIQEVK